MVLPVLRTSSQVAGGASGSAGRAVEFARSTDPEVMKAFGQRSRGRDQLIRLVMTRLHAEGQLLHGRGAANAPYHATAGKQVDGSDLLGHARGMETAISQRLRGVPAEARRGRPFPVKNQYARG